MEKKMKILEEVKKDLLRKGVVELQDMEVRMHAEDLIYDTDIIYEKEVLEEETLVYTVKFDEVENYDAYIYVDIEFIEKNEEEPWFSYVVVKDMYML